MKKETLIIEGNELHYISEECTYYERMANDSFVMLILTTNKMMMKSSL